MTSYHPTGVTVEIVGIESSDTGKSCEEHDVCGSVLCDDVVVRLRVIQVLNPQGKEETAIAAYWVTDGIDRCRVGFLEQRLVKRCRHYDGALAQITEVYCNDSESPSRRKKNRRNQGCCLAAIISALPETRSLTKSLTKPPSRKRQKINPDDSDQPAENSNTAE
jgi:hypothetical protein